MYLRYISEIDEKIKPKLKVFMSFCLNYKGKETEKIPLFVLFVREQISNNKIERLISKEDTDKFTSKHTCVLNILFDF